MRGSRGDDPPEHPYEGCRANLERRTGSFREVEVLPGTVPARFHEGKARVSRPRFRREGAGPAIGLVVRTASGEEVRAWCRRPPGPPSGRER